MRKKIIILNGPEGSGKSQLISLLEKSDSETWDHIEACNDIIDRINLFYHVPKDVKIDKENYKKPFKYFLGKTPWDVYLSHTLHFLDLHGKNYLLDSLVDNIEKSSKNNIVVSGIDQDEDIIRYLFSYFGDQVLVIKLFKPSLKMNGFSYVDQSLCRVHFGNLHKVRSTILNNTSDDDDLLSNFYQTIRKNYDE